MLTPSGANQCPRLGVETSSDPHRVVQVLFAERHRSAHRDERVVLKQNVVEEFVPEFRTGHSHQATTEGRILAGERIGPSEQRDGAPIGPPATVEEVQRPQDIRNGRVGVELAAPRGDRLVTERSTSPSSIALRSRSALSSSHRCRPWARSSTSDSWVSSGMSTPREDSLESAPSASLTQSSDSAQMPRFPIRFLFEGGVRKLLIPSDLRFYTALIL